MGQREMQSCMYVPVKNNKPLKESDDDQSWTPFLRQLLVSSGVWTQYFQFGLCIGAPTVIMPRLRQEESVSDDMASWISSAMGYAAIPWPFFIIYLCTKMGPRYTFAIGTLAALSGFVVLSVAHTAEYILVAMIVQGPLAALQMTLALLVLTEYCSPKYRGPFLTIKCATIYWGVWICNAIGTVWHWHCIAWLGCLCSAYILLTLPLWPDSPYWLASKGRMEECRAAHRWLRGESTNSENELEELIKEKQQEVDMAQNERNKSVSEIWRQLCLNIKDRNFYKPLLICLCLLMQYHFTGKLVYMVYAIDIIKDITKSTSDAYTGMLILDGVSVLGMYVGCVFAKKFARKKLFIGAGAIGSLFLIIISIYLFLVRHEIISQNKYVSLTFLMCYSLAISCGPMILNSTFIAEILPLKFRGTVTALGAMSAFLLMGTNLKLSPLILSSIGIYALFLFYGVVSGLFLYGLYLVLPETKDKTLKEIEQLMHGNNQDSKLGPRSLVRDSKLQVVQYDFEKIESKQSKNDKQIAFFPLMMDREAGEGYEGRQQ